MLLKRLAEAIGISSAEQDVRQMITEVISEHVDDLRVDTMGNLLVFKKGTRRKNRLKLLLAAHMDEVGFMVTGHDSSGFLSVAKVGGIDHKLLPALRVVVGKDKLPGVFTWKPIHLTKSQDIISLDNMHIDIGVSSKEAASEAAPLGTMVAFDSAYVELSRTVVRCKAFDDRVGCAELIELLQGERFPHDVYGAFTVQEEVGLRGARVVAASIQPDAAIILETTAAHEVPQDPDEPDVTTVTKMGRGPAIYYADRTTLSHPGLLKHLVNTAEAYNLPHQFRSSQFAGGTDAGSIHLSGAGVPAISIAVPCRYLHGPHSLISLDDYHHTIQLVRAALTNITSAELER
jgi:endoglucanase